MKSLMIVESIHHGNTRKIADAMAPILNAEIVKPSEVDASRLSEYDIIGFGSGIYFGKHHRNLLDLADKLPSMDKNAFIFSTCGNKRLASHRFLREKLESKNLKIVGEFSCKAWDTYSILGLIGGINKGRPDENDLEEARKFAKSIIK
ncbi:flavodoxin [Methanocella sp. CWC-04]|uniref:Flavodoxin n=1 Tax=Methanooceanicella nereidis TaxID=2052831 RepID=A0AAP2W4N2_9EURY|nr:flavodoxin family protein [Methanocella sp. CWC-04]MCD1293533.1 flavodoxin [Methanocella sp. CWC-04]